MPPELSIHHLIKAELQHWSFRLFTSRRKALWVDGCEIPLKMQATPESQNSSKSYDFFPVSCQDDLYFNAKRSVVFKVDPKWQLHCEYLCSIFPAILLLEFGIMASTLLKVLMLGKSSTGLNWTSFSQQGSLNKYTIDEIRILLLQLADSATEQTSCESYIANVSHNNFPFKDKLCPKSINCTFL